MVKLGRGLGYVGLVYVGGECESAVRKEPDRMSPRQCTKGEEGETRVVAELTYLLDRRKCVVSDCVVLRGRFLFSVFFIF